MIINPQLPVEFGELSVRTVMSSCLMTAFIILAALCGLNSVRNARARLKRLDDDFRTDTVEEEEFATVGSKRAPLKPMRDPWRRG